MKQKTDNSTVGQGICSLCNSALLYQYSQSANVPGCGIECQQVWQCVNPDCKARVYVDVDCPGDVIDNFDDENFDYDEEW